MRVFVLALFAFVPAAWGQSVTVYASVDSVHVGESFDLTVVARHAEAGEAVLPDTGRAFGGADLAVLERLQIGRAGDVDSAVYRVAAFALDTLVVPPIGIGFVRGRDTLLVPSSPFALPMIATAPVDADSLRPARQRMDFPMPLWVWLTGLLVLVLLAGLAYLIFRHLRKRPAPPSAQIPHLSPADAARQRLQALQATDLEDPAQVKPYYVALTEALRQYVEQTTGIPALEITSGELIRRTQHAARTGTLPADIPEKLVVILPVADFAKFADGLPMPAEGERARLEALAVIEQVEAYRAASTPDADVSNPEAAHA